MVLSQYQVWGLGMTVWAQNYMYYWAPAQNPRGRARARPKTSKPGALRAQILRVWRELLEASHSPGPGAGRVHKQPACAGVWLPMGLPARGLCPPRGLWHFLDLHAETHFYNKWVGAVLAW